MPASTSLTKWTPSTTRASATVLTISAAATAAATRPRLPRKRRVTNSSRQQPIVAPSAWPEGNDKPGAAETGGQLRAGSPDDFLQCEAEAGAAEDRHDEPRRVVSFASDQIHQRNQCEHDAKYVRIKGFADGLGRAHQFRMIGVDPVEHVRDARVEAAQRCPAGTDKQQE